MRNRLFLLALVATLLLAQAILRNAAQATPFSGGTTWGGCSFWELRGALPLGIFAAGALLVFTAAACQCLSSALRISDSAPRLRKNAGQLSSACLWCGVPVVASCMNALPYIFGWLGAYDTNGWQTMQHLEWSLNGSMIALIICHVLSQSTLADKTAYLTLLLPLGALLLVGQMGFNQAFIIIPCAIMAAAGALMLLGRGKAWAPIPLLTAVGMNACLFAQAAPAISVQPAAFFTCAAALILLAALLLLKLTALRA